MARSKMSISCTVSAVACAATLLTPWAQAAPQNGAKSSPAKSENEPLPEKKEPAVTMFIDLEWRVYTLGQHVSHGPALAAGASLLKDHLRVGFGALARPGPMNPTTFDVKLEEGTEYRGQSTVSLRNDGMMGGLHVSYSTPLPFARAFALQIPLTVGYGGFGYYLTGEDRNTPDGRRVSEWEDELFDNKDAYIGVVLDGAVRLRFTPRDFPWLMPYAGVGFTTVPGFKTVVRDDYFGISGLVGLEVGSRSQSQGR